MKIAPKYHLGNADQVQAYQDADLAKFQIIILKAAGEWKAEWKRQGALDQGTCCIGKGIQVWYLKPRSRIADRLTIVPCDFVQGNSSAQKSVVPALELLKANGVEAVYYDGQMD